ncbi:hypothetical protein ACHAW5_005745 [Stephanodiscus triporus]|uniref:TFA2 Winged helix domain-containing protein n=1 Tax=Stephanodiscus triporus TaxID=2934178 RepID=A0ABD3P6M9_9STRA
MAANAYGFDFLRAEHNLPSSTSANTDPFAGSAVGIVATPSARRDNDDATTLDVSHKSDLEKQADILVFLRHHRSSGCLPPSVIHKALGIDLSEGGPDRAVAAMLASNPKVKVEEVPDPENPSLSMSLFGYRAKFSDVKDRPTLLAQVNRMKNGIRWSDLADAYDGVEEDLLRLLTGGEVLGVANPEEKDRILFPRGESFLVELDGCVTVEAAETAKDPPEPPESSSFPARAAGGSIQARDARLICTDVDPRPQIRRGEAIRVGGEWRRVSSEIRPDLPLSKQPPRAQAPPSVVSMRDMSRKNDVDGYCRRFDSRTIPLDGPLGERFGLANLTSARAARGRLRAVAAGGGGGGGVGGASGGGVGAGTRGATVGGASAGALLSPFASERSASALVGYFAKSVAASFGIGRGGGGAESVGDGGRKRPIARVGARRPGDGVGAAGGGGAAAGGAAGGKGRAFDAEAIKAAVEDARRAASDPSLSYSHAVRHGCTKDVRDMYLETLSLIPASDVDLHRALLEHKLIDPGENMSRQRMKRKNNVDNDGKPKKRRYYERKNMRRTNTHLDGTEIGAMLAMAAERQAHGKSVGDGGM